MWTVRPGHGFGIAGSRRPARSRLLVIMGRPTTATCPRCSISILPGCETSSRAPGGHTTSMSPNRRHSPCKVRGATTPTASRAPGSRRLRGKNTRRPSGATTLCASTAKIGDRWNPGPSNRSQAASARAPETIRRARACIGRGYSTRRPAKRPGRRTGPASMVPRLREGSLQGRAAPPAYLTWTVAPASVSFLAISSAS